VKNGVTPADYSYPESDSGRYASLKGIMQAKKKPIDQKKLADLGLDAKLSGTYSKFQKPPERKGQTTFVENVEELVQKLHTEAKVI
jgi:electron transfer flavoprotein beta subunit